MVPGLGTEVLGQWTYQEVRTALTEGNFVKAVRFTPAFGRAEVGLWFGWMAGLKPGPFKAHQLAAPGAALMFTSGSSHGVALGEFEGEPLYNASLDTEEYRELLGAAGFEVVAHIVEDDRCGWRFGWRTGTLRSNNP